MRSLPFQLLLAGALLAWRLRKLGVSTRVERAVLTLAIAFALLASPHLFWGWQVQQHAPLALLRVEGPISAAWFFFAFGGGMALWAWQGLALRLARSVKLEPVDPMRRKLLAGAPLALAAAVPPGVAGAEERPKLRPVKLACPRLPAGFEGLRILQVSDLHLGPVLGLEWLEAALAQVKGEKIDLVAVTGDLADDVALMAPALARIAAIDAPLGHVIIPGNHEYYAGIDDFVRAVQASPFKLMTGEVTTLRRSGDELQLLGIDWPQGRARKKVLYARMLQELAPRLRPGFKLLLAHDPDAFDVSAPLGIDAQLSGHTHGGQIAPLGISPLAPWWLKYPSGLFAQGDSRLFVTRGLGHWFPFRIDCPTELPVIELVRG